MGYQEAIRLEAVKMRACTNELESVAISLKDDFFKASEWWRLSRVVSEYIDECERQWGGHIGELNDEKVRWLSWAREIANQMLPFAADYPNPIKHA